MMVFCHMGWKFEKTKCRVNNILPLPRSPVYQNFMDSITSFTSKYSHEYYLLDVHNFYDSITCYHVDVPVIMKVANDHVWDVHPVIFHLNCHIALVPNINLGTYF